MGKKKQDWGTDNCKKEQKRFFDTERGKGEEKWGFCGLRAAECEKCGNCRKFLFKKRTGKKSPPAQPSLLLLPLNQPPPPPPPPSPPIRRQQYQHRPIPPRLASTSYRKIQLRKRKGIHNMSLAWLAGNKTPGRIKK